MLLIRQTLKKFLFINPIDKKTPPPWFDKLCTQLKKMITAQGKKIKKEPNNKKYKSELTQLKRSLKRTVRKNKLNYEETILQKMNWSRKLIISFGNY